MMVEPTQNGIHSANSWSDENRILSRQPAHGKIRPMTSIDLEQITARGDESPRPMLELTGEIADGVVLNYP